MPSALADQLQQARRDDSSCAVGAQMVGQLVDALGQDGDLDFGGTGIAVVAVVLADQCGLRFLG